VTGKGSERRILFVTYDGVLGGPGRSQVLPYLRGYREDRWDVHLLSFEKPDLLAEEATRRGVETEVAAMGVRWTILPWRRAMLGDLASGLRAVSRIVDAERPSVLHARSYVPALLCQRAGRSHGARLLFDMRGLWPDERVEGGLWSARNPLYLLWKRLERSLLEDADGVVVLSKAGALLLREEGLVPGTTPMEVIPCGADLRRFCPEAARHPPELLRPFAGKRIYTLLGATATWYLLEPMLDFAAEAVRADPDARVLVLTEDPAGAVEEGLSARGVPPDRRIVARAPHAEVPRWIAGSRAGVFFIRPCRSKKASCPTKLAEFLGCGVPVVINEGIGDTGDIVRGAVVGSVLGTLDATTFRTARRTLDELHGAPGLQARCRKEAECTLDVRECAQRFSRFAGSFGSK
jgi:glycosyltransferase involved in cell wall biosynthesis